jgi:DNA-binding response OmpR family regulator
MMRALNPLERLGFVAAAAQRLHLTASTARLLLALIEAGGRPLSAATLAPRLTCRGVVIAPATVRVHACFLREALADQGLPALPFGGHAGYRLDPADAAVIFAAVVEGAG